jgi:hypothetical protein
MRMHPFIGWALSAAALMLTSVPAAAAPGDIERSVHRVARSGGEPAAVVTYAFDANRMRVQVLLATSLLDRAQQRRGSGVSVQAAAELPAVRKLMRHEMLLVNGGFSTSTTDRPAGLLISDGNAVTVPNYAMRRADPDNACPALRSERLRLSALLCVRADHSLSVGPMDDDAISRCEQAIQTGPVLLDKSGQPEVCASNGERAYLRTALCQRDARVHVVIATDPMTLHDLARWLAAPPAEGGLGCSAAINMSGDTSTGALYSAGAGSKPRIDGPGGFAQASFLLVTPRTAPGGRGE